MDDVIIILLLFLAVFLFGGEPDVHDSIIEYLQRDCNEVVITEKDSYGTN